VLAIADLLELLGAQNKTGILRVEGGSESFSVHLKHGKVIHASSDRAPQGERLGDILVRLGYISQGHLDAFLRGFMGSGRKLGEVLEKGSVVTTEQLAEALAEQVRLMFYRLFSLRDGRFSFRPEDVDDGAFQRVDLGLRWLLFESARQVDEARETAGPA
jgi:hypothetical protein